MYVGEHEPMPGISVPCLPPKDSSSLLHVPHTVVSAKGSVSIFTCSDIGIGLSRELADTIRGKMPLQ